MRPECDECELYKTCLHPFMKPEGPVNTGIILIVGEAPGETEDVLQRPFVGESGQILRRALAKAGLEEPYDLNPSTNYSQTPFVKNVVLYNCCVCRPPGNDTPTGTQAKCCFDNVINLIKQMSKLELIVPVGNVALRRFTGKQGITSVSGKEMKWEEYKMMPLLHPASFLYAKNRSKIKIFYDHVARIPVILQDNLVDQTELGIYYFVDTIEKWHKFKMNILQSSYFIFDIETQELNPFKDNAKIKLISFSIKNKEAWALPVWDEEHGEYWTNTELAEIINDLRAIFENEDIGKVGQNIKYDNLWMKAIFNIQVTGTIGDTALSQYILHPQDANDLKNMAWQYTSCGGYDTNIELLGKIGKDML